MVLGAFLFPDTIRIWVRSEMLRIRDIQEGGGAAGAESWSEMQRERVID